jgi:C4-dicarboxylate-specific signal transduction histidine kinase
MAADDRYRLLDDDPLEAKVTPPLALIGFLLLAGSFWMMSRRGGSVDPAALGLAVICEFMAVRTGGFGFFSFSAGAFLVSALHAPGLTSLALIGSLCMRTLVRSAPTPAQRGLEFISDELPLVMLLFLCTFTASMGPGLARPAICALGFLLVWWFTPGIFQAALDPGVFMHWSRCRNQLLMACLAQVSCGLWIYSQPAQWWLVVPVLLSLADAARRVSVQVSVMLDQGLRDKAEAQLSVNRRELSRSKSTQEEEGAKLEVQMDSYRLIERMLSSLRSAPTLKSVALAVLEQVRTRVPSNSVALFLDSNGSLKIVASISPDQDRVDSATMMGFRESLVERAWQRGRIETLEEEDSRDQLRIFIQDVSAVAAPIANRGVIYVGSQQEYQLSEKEQQYLESLARHSGLALQAAQSQEEQQLAYQRELLARQVSEKLLNRLADLVAGMNQLLPLSEPEQLVTAGAELMQRLLRSQSSWVHFKGDEKNSLLGPLEGIRELAQSSLKSRRPILHNEYQTSPFFRPGSPYRSVLVVPMVVHQQEAGFLLAASEEIFEREDQDILTLMALQFGPILETVRLFFDLQVAHEKLAESQAQLVQSSKMAAIGQLAGGVAHELNTPLGAVTVALDAIAMTIDTRPDKAKDRLEKTRKACAKMKSIIAKLLFYSRDSANRKEQTDMNNVVRDTLDFIGSQIRLENVEIDSQSQSLPPVFVNQNEIQQVLVNLLNNAKDAVLSDASSQKRIEIRTFQEGNDCCIQVRDFGPGIPEDKAQRIFEPFYTTKPVGHGTGLGLSVSMQLCEQNGGSLALLMHSGPGALFQLKLPQMDGSETD